MSVLLAVVSAREGQRPHASLRDVEIPGTYSGATVHADHVTQAEYLGPYLASRCGRGAPLGALMDVGRPPRGWWRGGTPKVAKWLARWPCRPRRLAGNGCDRQPRGCCACKDGALSEVVGSFSISRSESCLFGYLRFCGSSSVPPAVWHWSTHFSTGACARLVVADGQCGAWARTRTRPVCAQSRAGKYTEQETLQWPR